MSKDPEASVSIPIENFPDPVVIFNSDSILYEANEAFWQLIDGDLNRGTPRVQVRDKSLTSWIQEDDQGVFEEGLKRLFAQGTEVADGVQGKGDTQGKIALGSMEIWVRLKRDEESGKKGITERKLPFVKISANLLPEKMLPQLKRKVDGALAIATIHQIGLIPAAEERLRCNDDDKDEALFRQVDQLGSWLSRIERTMEVGSWSWDIPKNQVIWSDETYQLFGVRRDQFRNTRAAVLERVHPEDRAKFNQRVGEILKSSDQSAVLEFRVIRSDGTVLDLRVEAEIYRNREGRAERAQGLVYNITEKRRAEEALRRNEEHYRLIFENIRDLAIFTLDPNGKVASWNPGAERLYGYRVEEAMGSPGQRFHALENFDSDYYRRMLDIAKLEGRFESESWCIRKDQSRFWAHLIIRALRNSGGKLNGFIVLTRDISSLRRFNMERQRLLDAEIKARKLAEETMRRAKGLLQISAVLFEGETKEEELIRKLNMLLVPKFCDCCVLNSLDADSNTVGVMGYFHADSDKNKILRELISLYPSRINDPAGPGKVLRSGELEFAPVLPEPMRTVMAQEARHEKLLSSLGVVSYIVVPILVKGKIAATLSLLNTTKGRHFNESDLNFAKELAYRFGLVLQYSRLFRELRGAIRDREEILSFVSHDLKNPLTAMTLAARMIPRMTDPSVPKEQKIRLLSEQIIESANIMNHLISDLLDTSRIVAGKFKPVEQPCEVGELIKEAVHVMESAASSKGLRIVYELSDEALYVNCDKQQMLRVLTNLIDNAIKFTETGGVSVSAKKSTDGIEIAVSDTGSGIHPQDLAHIFERYWQGRGDGSARGTGLGLSIVKGITEAYGGRVWVQSRLGKGSTFHMLFPERKAEEGCGKEGEEGFGKAA